MSKMGIKARTRAANTAIYIILSVMSVLRLLPVVCNNLLHAICILLHIESFNKSEFEIRQSFRLIWPGHC